MVIEYVGVSTLRQKHHPVFFDKPSPPPPLNLQTAQSPFLGNPSPLHWLLVNPTAPKNRIFQRMNEYIKNNIVG